jgi:hypothetical protein
MIEAYHRIEQQAPGAKTVPSTPFREIAWRRAGHVKAAQTTAPQFYANVVSSRRGDRIRRRGIAGKADPMSRCGVDFMDEWLRDNIDADAPEPNDERVKSLAEQCLADASAEGISKQEIEEDMGSIEACIEGVMQRAADDEGQNEADNDDSA